MDQIVDRLESALRRFGEHDNNKPMAAPQHVRASLHATAAQPVHTDNNAVNHEIRAQMLRGASWNKLETCFKWCIVKKHLETHGIMPDDAIYKRVQASVKANSLVPSKFDAKRCEILALGVDGL